MHIRRLRRQGHVGPPPSRRTQFICSVDGCDGQALARHLCGKHYARWQTHGDPTINLKDRSEFRSGLDWRKLSDVRKLSWRDAGNGYRGIHWPEHPNANRNGGIAEHVAVIAAKLGRPLRLGENVHHKNGKRDDNRPENLEIWASKHPPGQRVGDLIRFAKEILKEYGDNPQKPR